MIRLLKIDGLEGRVETGAVQFNDDWPGLFIRGDNCVRLVQGINTLETILERQSWFPSDRLSLEHLLRLKQTIENDVWNMRRRGGGASEQMPGR